MPNPTSMMHVKQINELIETGKAYEAEDALEQLLALGPKNTEALKLKAYILSSQGRFEEELETWLRILKIDTEDQDATSWLQTRHLEEQEHRYFTDQLPGGGFKYLTYQRGLLKPMIFGLIGSLSFTFFTNIAISQVQALAKPEFLITGFLAVVLLPMIWVAKAYLTTMHSLKLDRSGISISTRLKTLSYNWDEFEDVFLCHVSNHSKSDLALTFIPKDTTKPSFEIDLNPDETSIRSRHHLIDNVAETFKKPTLKFRSAVDGIESRKVIRF